MKPAKLDLPTIWRGCDWGPITLKWKDANGDPINLTAWTPRAYSLNINLNAQKVLPQTGDNIGVTTISLTWVQTANLRLGVERWDWIWEQISGQPPRVNYRFPPFLTGSITVADPVTTIPPELPPIPGGEEVEEVGDPPEIIEAPSLVT